MISLWTKSPLTILTNFANCYTLDLYYKQIRHGGESDVLTTYHKESIK